VILIQNSCSTQDKKNWRRLLSCPASNEKLTHFFADNWKEKQEQMSNKVLYVTYGDKCLRICKDHTEEVEDLKTTHEEADTRLLLHTHHAAVSGFKSVILVVEDTDVLVLSLAFTNSINCDIYMRCGTKKQNKAHQHQ
jgi:hypothetical protein